MSQVPLEIVNAGLVQLPCDWKRGTRTVAVTPAGAVAGALVVVADCGAVVVTAGAVVVVALELLPEGGGNLKAWLGTLVVWDPPASAFPMYIPRRPTTTHPVSSCHVFHDRRSLMPSSPAAGRPVDEGSTGLEGSGGGWVETAGPLGGGAAGQDACSAGASGTCVMTFEGNDASSTKESSTGPTLPSQGAPSD